MEDERAWATAEFGHAELGDGRRTKRLLTIAARVAARPGGQITGVFDDSAGREGTFKFVENDEVKPEAIARASHQACASRCAGMSYVFVPVDGSSLNITDDKRNKGTGVVGSRRVGARGFQVMTALAVAPDGLPLGLCGQTWWSRDKASAGKKKGHDRRPVAEKETKHWLTVMAQVREALTGRTTPWFQLDRGGDAWPVILDGLEPAQLFTVRATHDRRLRLDTSDCRQRYLREVLLEQPLLGQYTLQIPAAAGRRGRTAQIELRAERVTLDFKVTSKKHQFAEIWALLARETKASVPAGEKPIEWLLLTTKPVTDEEAARLVVFGYAQRWRIEEFHRLWKSGACNVEDTQLRDKDNILRWVTILAAVAVRLLRLTYLARTSPHTPATTELSRAELKAIVLARKMPLSRADSPTIADAVRWLAQIGGYVGYKSSGPPGALTLARGLDRIRTLVDVLENRDQW